MKHNNDNITVPPVREVVQFRNDRGYLVLERTFRRDNMKSIVPQLEWVTYPIAYVFPDTRPVIRGKHRKDDPLISRRGYDPLMGPFHKWRHRY